MPGRTPSFSRAQWLSTGAALLLACAVLLPLLGHKPLTDWDEGIYAEVSREMLQSGWLTPHWNGNLWFEKPPLMLWITAFFFKCFGVNEFWARAASAFSGITLVGVIHGWLLLRKDRLTAWLATVFLLATPGILHICRTGEMDAMLTLFTAIALIGLAELNGGHAAGWLIFWTGFAAALMTKGAASVIILLTLFVLATVGGWKRDKFVREFWAGLLVFLTLTVPWHAWMLHLYGRQFLEEYLGFHVFVRATQQIEGHTTPWYYFGIVLLSYAWPFLAVFLCAIPSAWREARLRPWVILPVVSVVFFSLIQTRLPHYIAPAYPALALLSACLAGSLLQVPRPTRTRLALLALAAVIWVIPLALTSRLRSSLHNARPESAVVMRDRRESIDMARLAATLPVSGPLLVWRDGAPASIAAEVFYARRRVQQVQLATPSAGPPPNRYAEARVALSQTVTPQPQLLLVDNALLTQLPSQDHFNTLRMGRTVTLVTITRLP